MPSVQYFKDIMWLSNRELADEYCRFSLHLLVVARDRPCIFICLLLSVNRQLLIRLERVDDALLSGLDYKEYVIMLYLSLSKLYFLEFNTDMSYIDPVHIIAATSATFFCYFISL